ncbi:DUF3500 domain-containing protein [Dyadobacter sandarakinus]|uniref:DUF3500 domain-containing protein n=2 Tax=Dyadobacter sandarakinus TaxID=2747268 RepID=A0ABX7IE70_9BACT|nr:DUF3500 domain-containing protein [Dyadobacter sandarakinus]
MSELTSAFLGTLSAAQKADAQLTYADSARSDWHFTPRERKGLPLKKMSPAQRKAAMAMLQLVLSDEGYRKANAIIDLENVLRVVESRPPNDTYRDPENFSFLVFGEPGTGPWGWRVEGHHLSLHFSLIDGEMTYTPSFMGSNPGKVLADVPQKGKVVLQEEQELAFKLLHTLKPDQLGIAVIKDKAPYEMVTANARKASLDKMEGITMADLSADQKQAFTSLIMAYLRRYHVTLKNQQWQSLEKAGLDQIHFAWMGDREPLIGEGHGHYYRIHGPTFLIEFDNTQNGGNHIHSVVRDLTNDFGEDLLRLHYQKSH